MTRVSPPRVLAIAGSDSGGGAGVQADIKTVTMLGGFAMTAITAITAQNTVGVTRIDPVDPDMVMAQIDACVDDLGVDAIKIGMLGSATLAHRLADRLGALRAGRTLPVIFDPVMVATSGATLADAATIAGFAALLTQCDLVTPNLPELEALGGEDAVLRIAPALLVKGGHGDGAMLTDRLVTAGGAAVQWTDARIDSRATHGTGCTLASAIATGMGAGLALPDAIARARTFVRLAIREAPGFGAGSGPMGHHGVRIDGAGLNQMSLPLRDAASAVPFYEALGLTLIVDAAPRYLRFEDANGATLSLHDGDARVYRECADLDAAVAAMRTAGIAVADPVAQSWGWREAWTRDPAGTAVCLYQAGEARRFPPWRIVHA